MITCSLPPNRIFKFWGEKHTTLFYTQNKSLHCNWVRKHAAQDLSAVKTEGAGGRFYSIFCWQQQVQWTAKRFADHTGILLASFLFFSQQRKECYCHYNFKWVNTCPSGTRRASQVLSCTPTPQSPTLTVWTAPSSPTRNWPTTVTWAVKNNGHLRDHYDHRWGEDNQKPQQKRSQWTSPLALQDMHLQFR